MTVLQKRNRLSRLQTVAGVAAVPVLMTMIGGCNTVPKADYDEAIAENNELRDRIEALQGTVRQAEDDKSVLREQNQELDGEVRRLQQQTATASTQQPGTQSGGAPRSSNASAGQGLRSTDVVVTVAGDVLFNSGQVTLKAEGRRELDTVARLILSQYPANLIRVEGYTDTDPIRRSKWKSNERLSSERALAVEEYLVSRGVDRDQIYSAAMGPANPKTTKSASRRVEIVILAAN
ncbi:MAG: OmpA family protein [Planctomycetota bacterium]